ncbi:MAG: dihydroxyacetone kinase subunit L [Devosiaceae bacterium]|nr:dihydroxyacetone kinase subunit L [Devosiaceae bacterium]
MTTHILDANAGSIVVKIADVIIQNRAYLSEIDGKIGDGDHGVNMAKGFKMAAARINENPGSLSEALATLGDVLVSEIGGSMGPLYGMMFMDMAEAAQPKIEPAVFSSMLNAGLEGVQSIGDANLGDKTLLDTLIPAVTAFDDSVASGASFEKALDAMVAAAETGRNSTIDMVAKVGRASRLGERSRGVVDAGATSCHLIIAELCQGVRQHLQN